MDAARECYCVPEMESELVALYFSVFLLAFSFCHYISVSLYHLTALPLLLCKKRFLKIARSRLAVKLAHPLHCLNFRHPFSQADLRSLTLMLSLSMSLVD